MIFVLIGLVMAAVISFISSMFGNHRTNYTGPSCPAGLCTPDRNHVLTDHYGTETYTSAGRRAEVPSPAGYPVEIPAKKDTEIEIAPGMTWKVR